MIFEEIDYFKHVLTYCIRQCISMFSKIESVGLSKPCTHKHRFDVSFVKGRGRQGGGRGGGGGVEMNQNHGMASYIVSCNFSLIYYSFCTPSTYCDTRLFV